MTMTASFTPVIAAFSEPANALAQGSWTMVGCSVPVLHIDAADMTAIYRYIFSLIISEPKRLLPMYGTQICNLALSHTDHM